VRCQGGRRQEAGGRRQEAGGRRQEAGGRRQEDEPPTRGSHCGGRERLHKASGVGLEPSSKNINRPQGAGLKTLLVLLAQRTARQNTTSYRSQTDLG
jgi:hypothetical protein